VRILLLAILFTCNSISASDSIELYKKVVGSVPKNSEIVIIDFTPQLGGVFKAFNSKLDGEGEFYFRAEHLAKALDMKYKAIIKTASKMKDQKFTLKNDLSIVEGGVFMEDAEYSLKPN
jgi:hypothetical protein